MESAITIDEFNVLMRSKEENALLAGLRSLCKLDEPKKVLLIRTSDGGPTPDASWGGWTW